ncbi:prolyl oligopeptidase family serine peptidase [Streptomyces sp. NPDC002521]
MTNHTYPDAMRLNLVEDVFGHAIADPYRWLEDAGTAWARHWAAEQDALFSAHQDTWAHRKDFRARLRALHDHGALTAPRRRGNRLFFTRRDPGQQHAVLYTAKEEADAHGREHILLDPNSLDPSAHTTLDRWEPSPDGELLAYQVSTGGTEHSRLHVARVSDGQILDGPIDRCRHASLAWLPDGKAFFYVRQAARPPRGEEQYHRRVWLHRVGTSPDKDELIFGDQFTGPVAFYVQVDPTGRWLLVTAVGQGVRNTQLWLGDLHAAPRSQPLLSRIDTGGAARVVARLGADGRLYILTDRDATQHQLCVADLARPSAWTTLLHPDPAAPLIGYAVIHPKGSGPSKILAHRLRHGASELTIHDARTGAQQHKPELPGNGSVTLPETVYDDHVWLAYSDYLTPGRVLHYDPHSGTTRAWAQSSSVGYHPQARVERVTYPSTDGTQVRMTLITPAPDPDGAQNETPRPTILHAYGGFGKPLTPAFHPELLAWVQAGGVFAIAHVRGGGEEGPAWHHAGRRESKQRGIDDFHAAADWLITNGWTTAEHLGAYGGSNGGLLVGAALTQRPELYKAVVCAAPVLDMVRYERSGLGPSWTPEYGSAHNPEELPWLLAYSPYHHVREGTQYPAVLFTVFDNDTRVDPLHARKMCAALQHATSADPDRRPILLRRQTHTGHSQRAIKHSIALASDTFAFFSAYLRSTAAPRTPSDGFGPDRRIPNEVVKRGW